ncbi:hypothetical protein FHW79_006058 [Azospirillum sp. OGB3]|uniref:hypothetical protein n=1 Tax=Azospirillum sp. OGB3 TaxID=2587012 RepID=UPI001605E237|nr:hypothetical protein [Azospirillum sp. OGB3]MBB3268383.1 hypothetical protein [Azospirillum sp. OGB3]
MRHSQRLAILTNQLRRSTVIMGIASLLALLALVGVAIGSELDEKVHAFDRARYPQDPALPFLLPAGPQLFGSWTIYSFCLAISIVMLVSALIRSVIESSRPRG